MGHFIIHIEKRINARDHEKKSQEKCLLGRQVRLGAKAISRIRIFDQQRINLQLLYDPRRKKVLIDTVFKPFSGEFIENLSLLRMA
jgi:hypothetical protein